MKLQTGLAALALVAALPAHAVPVFFTNATGLATPTTTVTFSEIPLVSGDPLTTEYAGFGISFVGAYYDPQPGFFPTPSVGNFSFTSGAQSAVLEFDFSAVQTEVAFQLVTNSGISTFSAYLGSALVAVGTASTSVTTPVPYYGFTGGSFDRIILLAPQNAALLLDNLQLSVAGGGTVPEPATWGLMIAGFAMVGFAARRRRTAVSA